MATSRGRTASLLAGGVRSPEDYFDAELAVARPADSSIPDAVQSAGRIRQCSRRTESDALR